jgi:hypothetical protein
MSSPIVIPILRNSTWVPDTERATDLPDDEELEREHVLMTRHGTEAIFASASDARGEAILLVNRLLVDPERILDAVKAEESKAPLGLGFSSKEGWL